MPKPSEESLAALTENSERSHKATRQALELAFARLRNGNPRVMPKGTPVTPTAVAKEAGSAKVHWLTHRTNATARLLYDRIATETGFIQYSKAL